MKEVPYISKWESGESFTMLTYIDFINERIRVDDYRGNILAITKKLKELAKQYCFSKEIIKSRREDWRTFLSLGYEFEGVIDGYFSGSDLFFMTNYHTIGRRKTEKWKEEDDLLQSIANKSRKHDSTELPIAYTLRIANKEDKYKLAALYAEVFQAYPTPMNDHSYIEKTIDGGTVFYVVEWNNELVSAASAEICKPYHNAEITDCATLPKHRKFGFMKILISRLEIELMKRQIYCSYSLARAQSYGMNRVFKQLNYQYTGRLTNNCIMNGAYEDMNIWVKKLAMGN